MEAQDPIIRELSICAEEDSTNWPVATTAPLGRPADPIGLGEAGSAAEPDPQSVGWTEVRIHARSQSRTDARETPDAQRDVTSRCAEIRQARYGHRASRRDPFIEI